jgi:parallel beta-helix repeat protein
MKKQIYFYIAILILMELILPFIFAWSDDSTTVQNVDGCNELNTTNAVYTLISNVTSTGTCFTINANNITLDCQGYEINYSSNGGDNKYGVFSLSDVTIVKNCIIKEGLADGIYDSAIYFYSSDNGIINNNTITTIGNYGRGIYLLQSLNNIISNNIITTSGYFGYGISLETSSDSNIISNNTIITITDYGYGIYLQSNTYNNSFSNMNIKTENTEGYAFYLEQNNHNFGIKDSILNSSYLGVSEVYIYNAVTGGTWDFINVTKSDGSPITINWQTGANGTLNMMWYLDVNVTDGVSPLENANVTGFQNITVSIFGHSYTYIIQLFSELTDGTGFIPTQILPEYTQSNATEFYYYKPLIINTTLNGYDDDSQIVNMSGNRQLNVILIPTLILSERFSGTGQAVYSIMDSAGAGLGSFMTNIAQGSFGFLVIIGLIAVFIIIGFAVAMVIVNIIKSKF